MKKIINEGCRIPKFYGVAWDSYHPAQAKFFVVCYPIPLNLILRWIRRAYLRLQTFGRMSYKDRLFYTENWLQETQAKLIACEQKLQMLEMLEHKRKGE